jgi:hypothetical protein
LGKARTRRIPAWGFNEEATAPTWTSANSSNLDPITKLIKMPNTKLCAVQDLPDGTSGAKSIKSLITVGGSIFF